MGVGSGIQVVRGLGLLEPVVPPRNQLILSEIAECEVLLAQELVTDRRKKNEGGRAARAGFCELQAPIADVH